MKILKSNIQNFLTIIVSFLFINNRAMSETSAIGLFVEPAITYEYGSTVVDYPSFIKL